jgi:hypothetical protein
MNKSCEKKPPAHSQNILHVDVLYNIKRKKYKTVCAELAFAKSQWNSNKYQFYILLFDKTTVHTHIESYSRRAR